MRISTQVGVGRRGHVGEKKTDLGNGGHLHGHVGDVEGPEREGPPGDRDVVVQAPVVVVEAAMHVPGVRKHQIHHPRVAGCL